MKLNTRVCSDHFVNSCGHKLRANEYQTLGLPKLSTSRMSPKKRKVPTTCSTNEGEQSLPVSKDDVDDSMLSTLKSMEAGVQVGSSYKQLVSASTCIFFFPEKPLQL